MAGKIAVCAKCGKKYPRWRLEYGGICERRVPTKHGWSCCCGSIVAEETVRMQQNRRNKETAESAMADADGVD